MFKGRGLEQPPGGRVPRGVASLQQCLELPGTCPPVPVSDVGTHGADERAGTTLGAEVGVDAERAGADRYDRTGERRIDLGPVPGDKKDVDVARVVELVRTVLAHGDDSQVVIGSGEAYGAGQHPVGDERERACHLLEVGQSVEIACSDLEETKVLAAHKVIDVIGLSGVPAHPAGPGDLSRLPHVESREHLNGRRVGHDHARQRAAGCRDRGEPGGETRLGLHSVASCRERGEELVGHQPHRVGSRRRADELVEQVWRWHRRRVLSRRLPP